MKKTIFFLLSAFICLNAFADNQKDADKDTKAGRYEIVCAGNAQPGCYLVKVSSYNKKQEIAEKQCRKNAVHGVLFKGFTGDRGCTAQRALINTPGAEDQNAKYFDNFFATGGEADKYASIVPGTTICEKVGKEYKVTCTVTVRKDELRKVMEDAGIVKSFNTGF